MRTDHLPAGSTPAPHPPDSDPVARFRERLAAGLRRDRECEPGLTREQALDRLWDQLSEFWDPFFRHGPEPPRRVLPALLAALAVVLDAVNDVYGRGESTKLTG